MELKVWVEGVPRVVCGVTDATTCHDVVIALAQALGRTGRYTLIERWRDTERHLCPGESLAAALAAWGQHSADVQLLLRRTGPGREQDPGPGRAFPHQSLPHQGRQRPAEAGARATVVAPEPDSDSLRRREVMRKSLTFTPGIRKLLEKASGGRGHGEPAGGPGAPVPPARPDELKRLVRLQNERLRDVEIRVDASDAELRRWEECDSRSGGADDEDDDEDDDDDDDGGEDGGAVAAIAKEAAQLEAEIARNEREEAALEAEWRREAEREAELAQRLSDARERARTAGEAARRRTEEARRLEAEVAAVQQRGAERGAADLRARLAEVEREARSLEGSLVVVHCSLEEAARSLRDKEGEAERLGRELRQLHLQQFIAQTGSRVTVLSEPPDDATAVAVDAGSVSREPRLVPTAPHVLHTSLLSSFNPESIYV
ncbi:ras association domain-containing protein 8-like [Lethenteron reissneri]|uniref:ras association domain-containing protein 8-like n=1 Tax=Lethenteron reissneri TaxID=7753 RepID=UPI002AB7DE01|nr:ras association domain-containing protein 8-like [Lethenteron reissneri]